MATPTNIVKFLVRRGTNSDRKAVVLAQGELGATIDSTSNRLFVGDGVTLGGKSVASRFYLINGFSDITTLQYVEQNDVVFNAVDSHLYALTGTISTLSANYCYIGR